MSEDAKSHLRGQLMALKDEIDRAIRKAADKPTELHLRAASHRIAYAPQGARNDTLNSEAYALARFVRAGKIRAEDLAYRLAYAAASGQDSARCNAATRLTAGLRCAPDTGPKIRISTTNAKTSLYSAPNAPLVKIER